MKTVTSILLGAACLGLISDAVLLSIRIQQLEGRLRGVEIKMATPGAPQTAQRPLLETHPKQNFIPFNLIPPNSGNLERRVEKLEQQLTPHFEYLPNATSR